MSLSRLFVILVFFVSAFLLAAACTQPAGTTTTKLPAPAPSSPASSGSPRVLLETTAGNITIALDPDMPVTAGNFASLVKKGFYNGVIFHRVISGFMIQGGDPTGTGSGGPGYTIMDEFTNPPHKNERGAVAMANAGPNTGGSQFFINLVDNSVRPGFDSSYPVFGNVVDGMEVVDTIAQGKTSGPPNDRPLQPVTIVRAEMV